MKAHLKARFWGAGPVIATLLAVCGAAQDGQVSTPDTRATKGAQTGSNDSTNLAVSGVKTSGQSQAATPRPPSVVEEILRMTDAGVSKEVIKAYVEKTRSDFSPTAADIIALKEHAVPDDITTALLKRSEEIQAQKTQTSPTLASPADFGCGLLDPESYSYFQYYYLYPRTLAHACEKLGGYYQPLFPGSYFSFNSSFGPGYRRAYGFGQPGGIVRLNRVRRNLHSPAAPRWSPGPPLR